jgi:hypothetical protein
LNQKVNLLPGKEDQQLKLSIMSTAKFFLENGKLSTFSSKKSSAERELSSANRYSLFKILVLLAFPCVVTGCQVDDLIEEEATVASTDNPKPTTSATGDQYILEQAISDEAQGNTIAFDGLGFMTGNLGSQTFLPPGKVADYSGFQYLRDNDPTQMGHNTSFVTIIAFNMLNILTTDQINQFVIKAKEQITQINDFGYRRFPICQAYRRLFAGTLPIGKTSLNRDAIKAYMGDLYKLDGQISYTRAQLFGKIIGSMSTVQKAKLDALKALNGIGNWNATIANPLDALKLQQDVNVAVMTYASEMYAWYAGSVTADVYFCPERHGTYFGSFYLKDWPAMGNPNYTIDETMTANAGQNFLSILTTNQAAQIKGIVNLQRNALMELVQKRTDISTELRKFLTAKVVDYNKVLSLSKRYGELDGELSYYYATIFSQVYKALTTEQKSKLTALAASLGYISPTGAFLYSQPITMPAIPNTDFLFR